MSKSQNLRIEGGSPGTGGWERCTKGCRLSVRSLTSSGDLMYNMKMLSVLINLIMAIIPQCIQISNSFALKIITFCLSVNYLEIKREKQSLLKSG